MIQHNFKIRLYFHDMKKYPYKSGHVPTVGKCYILSKHSALQYQNWTLSLPSYMKPIDVHMLLFPHDRSHSRPHSQSSYISHTSMFPFLRTFAVNFKEIICQLAISRSPTHFSYTLTSFETSVHFWTKY